MMTAMKRDTWVTKCLKTMTDADLSPPGRVAALFDYEGRGSVPSLSADNGLVPVVLRTLRGLYSSRKIVEAMSPSEFVTEVRLAHVAIMRATSTLVSGDRQTGILTFSSGDGQPEVHVCHSMDRILILMSPEQWAEVRALYPSILIHVGVIQRAEQPA